MPFGTEVGLSLCHIVLDGDSDPLPYRDIAPQFSANVRCGQTAGWTKMPLGMEVGLGPGHFGFDGDPATPATPEKGHSHPTQFLAHVYCGQTAGWIKMPVRAEANLGPGDVGVAPPPKTAQP